MKKNKISSYFYFISIFTFLALFFFIIQKSYDNLMKDTISVLQSDIIKPISSDLDISVLDEIETREFFTSP